MQFIPIKTRKLIPPKDNLFKVFDESLTNLQEGDIVLVTSKVVAIHQGRCIPVASVSDKNSLILKEAEQYLEAEPAAKYPIMLTIKHHTLIASSGIDESNAKGHYILWPEHIDKTAKEIWAYLRRKNKIKKLGVIVTDSHSLPMRWGVLGVAIGFFGFEPTIDLRGKKDLFGRKLTMTRQNIPDAISALGVFLMGESNESTPLLVVRDFPSIQFISRASRKPFWVNPKDDMYKQMLAVFKK